MSGLAMPKSAAPKTTAGAVASSSKAPAKSSAKSSVAGSEADDDEGMGPGERKAYIGVPEITTVQGLIPTLQ